MSILDYFLGSRKKSANVARERLQIILAHEHAGRTGPDYRNAPPEFAAHTDEILREYGFSDARIAELRDTGVAPASRT